MTNQGKLLLTAYGLAIFVVCVSGLVGKEEVIAALPDNLTDTTTVMIWCAMSNTLVNTVTWYRFHQEVDLNCSTTSANVTCELGKVGWNEIGEYTCSFNVTSNNTKGWEVRNSTIQVKSPPGAMKWESAKTVERISDERKTEYMQESVIVKTGGNTEIHCKFRGYPIPTVEWLTMDEGGDLKKPLKNDRSSMSSVTNEDSTEVTYSLKIDDLEFEDRKFYVCEASNDYGTSSIQTLLRVKWSLAWIYPAIGIFFEVLIFGAIMILVRCRENKRNQD